MKKFKYPLAISGTEQQLKDLIPKLEELGYRWASYTRNDYDEFPILMTGYVVNEGIGFHEKIVHRFPVSADNPELVLALAACVEEYEFHVGEIIYTSEDSFGWGLHSQDQHRGFPSFLAPFSVEF